MNYTAAFFGTILSVSFFWKIATGDFPKGYPLVILWVIALGLSFYIGYRRFYLNPVPEINSKKK